MTECIKCPVGHKMIGHTSSVAIIGATGMVTWLSSVVRAQEMSKNGISCLKILVQRSGTSLHHLKSKSLFIGEMFLTSTLAFSNKDFHFYISYALVMLLCHVTSPAAAMVTKRRCGLSFYAPTGRLSHQALQWSTGSLSMKPHRDHSMKKQVYPKSRNVRLKSHLTICPRRTITVYCYWVILGGLVCGPCLNYISLDYQTPD